MTRAPRLLLATAAAALLGAGQPPPRRVVSVTLCADQHLLHLADRAQIAGLSRNAADPALSASAARTQGLNVMRGSAEALIALRPDLIVAIPGYGVASTARKLEAPGAETYPAIVAELRLVGAALGHAARAERLARAMDRRLAALPRNPGRGRVAAYYQRRGYLTGTGTLVDDLMGRLGLVNLAARLGKPPLAQLSLEELVAARPDFLILESATASVADQGTEMLHHPALKGIPRLWLPQAWTVCGSPEYVLAAESLARQLARHR